MCNNPKFTWFDVLEETCGKCEPAEALTQLCDIHEQIVREQLADLKV